MNDVQAFAVIVFATGLAVAAMGRMDDGRYDAEIGAAFAVLAALYLLITTI